MANLAILVIQSGDKPNIVQIERKCEQKVPFPHQIVVQGSPLADVHAQVDTVVVAENGNPYAHRHAGRGNLASVQEKMRIFPVGTGPPGKTAEEMAETATYVVAVRRYFEAGTEVLGHARLEIDAGIASERDAGPVLACVVEAYHPLLSVTKREAHTQFGRYPIFFQRGFAIDDRIGH